MSNLISIDLEMNQPSNKIIQLGYVIFNVRTGRLLTSKCININPKEPLDPYIITLTNLTDEILASGTTLSDGYSSLLADMAQYNVSRTCVQWGAGDARLLQTQLGISTKDYIFRGRTFDVKSMFQVHGMFLNTNYVMGLGKACETLGLPFQGTQHNAMDDALNTKEVFMYLGRHITLADRVKKVLK